MDEEATRTRRTSVRDDQMDDGLSAFSASRADQGDSGTGTQRPMLRSQTHAEHTRRAPAAQPAAGPHNMRGPLLAPGLHGANAPSAFLHSLLKLRRTELHTRRSLLRRRVAAAAKLLPALRF